jgi:hypothetical protein
MNIRKKSGELQEFDRRKLEESMKRAGASEEVARRVSERIQPSEGQSTDEIRKRVAEELRREDPATSGAYASAKRLRARSTSDAASGVARLHAELLRQLEAKPGDRARLSFGEKTAEVRLEQASAAQPHEVQLHRADLERLGASEGSRVVVSHRA